jgi:hypothetical protein
VTDSASTAASEAATADDQPAAPSTSTEDPLAEPGEVSGPTYWERLYLPWYHWLLPLFAAGLLAAEVNMGYPGVRAWLPYLITVPLTLLLLWRFGSAKVEVRDGELWAGEAHLPLRYAGETQIIPGNLKRKVLGPAFDPAAFALHRSWVGPMVWIHVTDENDPTPYWLLSTRHPEKLVAAIEAGGPRKADETD